MRSLRKPAIWVLLFTVVFGANPAIAQERSSSGRHKPASLKVQTEASEETKNEDIGSWSVEFSGGLLSGSDFFSAYHTTGDTLSWVPEEQGDWVSHRIRVGLKSSLCGGIQVQRRMGDWYSLRAGATFSRMELSAEAPVGEMGEVFTYDQADVWLLSAGGEIRLTIQTPSYPYLTGDIIFLDFSPDRSDFLSQSNLGGRLAIGYHHQFDPMWAINVEIGISRSVLAAIYLPTPEDAEPENIEVDNESHLSLFEAKFGIRLKI